MEEVEQICTRIGILDHGRCIASGTKEELKNMIKTGERVTVEAVALNGEQLAAIKNLAHVFSVDYEDCPVYRSQTQSDPDSELSSGTGYRFWPGILRTADAE